MSLEKFHFLL
jgi:hypothetical protein